MIRKQLYIEEHQDAALKRRARELGISEAELVRRALDDLLEPRPGARPGGREARALEDLFGEADAIAESHRFPDHYRFERRKLYDDDERQKRWD